MPLSPQMAAAITLLSSLRPGDPVNVTQDGRTYLMTVSRGPDRSDGKFGSVESTGVTVTLGPGRWSRRVDAAGIAHGTVSLTRARVVAR